MNLKRCLALGGTLVAAVVLLASCGASSASKGPTEITLWDFLSGGDGVRWTQILDKFNSDQTALHVTHTTLTWGDPFYTKVHTAVVAGETPDVMTYHLSHFPAGIIAGDLRPFTQDELNKAGLPLSDFNPILVKQSLAISQAYGIANDVYGVPLDTHTSVLYYNKDLLKKAGLLGPDGTPQGITGVANFTAALEKIKRSTDAQFAMVMSTANDPATVWRMWYTLFSQQGGTLASGGKVTLDQVPTLGTTALQTMVDWTTKGLIPANFQYPAAVALFLSGKAAFMFNGNWEVPTVVDAKANGKLTFDYGVAAFPQLFDNQDTWADSHNLAIPANTKHRISKKQFNNVMTLINYIEKHADIWAGGGHLPAYLPVLNGPALASMVPNNEYTPQAAKDVTLEPVSPVFGVGDPAYDAVGNFLTPALTGQLTVQDAISKFQAQLQSLGS